MKRSIAAALVIPALLIGTAAGCTAEPAPKAAASTTSTPEAVPVVVEPEPEVRPTLDVMHVLPAGWEAFTEGNLTYGAPSSFQHDLDYGLGDYHGTPQPFWQNADFSVFETIDVGLFDKATDPTVNPDGYLEDGDHDFSVPGAVAATVRFETVLADPDGMDVQHFAGMAYVKASDTQVYMIQFTIQDPATGVERVKELLGTLTIA